MALYGMTRLLGTRELGPAQIVPTLEGFRGDLGLKRERLDQLLGDLAAATEGHEHLREAFSLVRPPTVEVLDEVGRVFDRPFKLGAKQRLELEREAPRLGGRLQAVRSLLDTVLCGLQPQPVPLRLADILDGPLCRPPIFIESTRHLLVACNAPMVEGEVRVLRPMIEALLRQRPADGLDFLDYDVARQTLTVQPNDGALLQTVDRIAVPLGPALGIEVEVSAAVGRHLGAQLAFGPEGGSIVFAA